MLGVSLDRVYTRKGAIDKIFAALWRGQFLHVVSLNPENIIIATRNPELRTIMNTAEVQIVDGAGVFWAGKRNHELKDDAERVTGVDLLTDLMKGLLTSWNIRPIVVAFVGGRNGVASAMEDHYIKIKYDLFPNQFVQLLAIPDLDAYDPQLVTKLRDAHVNLAFFAFGCPTQELWIEHHRDILANTVCIGVGGAFDYISGRVTRAPEQMRESGLEWLFRLIVQPWRLFRQLRLIEFVWRVWRGEKTGR